MGHESRTRRDDVAGEVIDGALPRAKANKVEHRAALPYADVPAALAAVAASTAGETVRAAIRFAVLTARPGPARSGARRGRRSTHRAACGRFRPSA